MRAGLEVLDRLGLSRENIALLEDDGFGEAGTRPAQIDHDQRSVHRGRNVRVIDACHQQQLRRVVVVDLRRTFKPIVPDGASNISGLKFARRPTSTIASGSKKIVSAVSDHK